MRLDKNLGCDRLTRGARVARPAAWRTGFTLIELMVAMALTMFVMLILTQAFVTSLDTFSGLKAIGDLQANLRSAGMIIQADLGAPHFEGIRRLRDADMTTIPPRQGFFAVYQGSPALPATPANNLPGYWIEGIESGFTPPTPSSPADLQSYRATNHVLYFTVKAVGNRPENVFSAPVPNNSPLLSPLSNFYGQSTDSLYQPAAAFNSQWAEVCYFLVPTGGTEGPNSGTPLFALYRGQYLLVPNTVFVNSQPAFTSAPLTLYHNVSCYSGATGLMANAPEDVTNMNNRVLIVNPAASPPVNKRGEPLSAAGVPYGCTQVLNNVVSFQVQVFMQQPGMPMPEFMDPVFGTGFDTANPTVRYNVLAVKVTLLIWDSTSKQSRQITIVQDM